MKGKVVLFTFLAISGFFGDIYAENSELVGSATENTVALAKIFSGRVLDDTGAPLVGAHVQVSNDKNAGTTTDNDGYFRLSSTSSDALKVKVSFVGFQSEYFVLKSFGNGSNTLRLSPNAAALEQVVVTGTRTPKALKDAPVVTRVITAEDIKIADATNVQDLLTEELPGVEFGYAMSQETSLNMNGFGGNAVLFLVDGERLAGETMNNVDYNRLNMDNVGRIEVVKGAASALYGANAVGGVVNIITRENTEPWTVNVNSRYSAFNDEWRYGGNVSFNVKKWNSQTSVQRTTSETVQLTSPFDTESYIVSIYGGESLNIKERLTFKATDRLKFIARGSYFDRVSNRSNYDDHYKGYSGGLKAVVDISKNDNLEVSYAYDQYDKLRYESVTTKDSVTKKTTTEMVRTHNHDYSNRQHTVHALYSHIFKVGTLTIGGDYMNDYLTTYQFLDNEDHSQSSLDGYVQFDYNPLRWLNVVGSVRHDYYSASKHGATTARLALMTKWKYISVRANYAGGFRAPTLKEMYMCFDMAGMMMIYGNPDLKPEKSHNFNVALEHAGRVKGNNFFSGQYSANVMGYYNIYENRITTDDYDDGNEKSSSRYTNEAGVNVMGIDASAQYRTDMGLGLKFNYNYVHMTGRTVDSQFSQPRPSSATWRIDYDHQFCTAYGLNAAVSGRFLSEPDTDQEKHDGAYQIWKFTLQQRLFDGISINFNIDNLFNYVPEAYYWSSCMTKGRTWSLGISMDVDRFVKAVKK